jgi:hypothetical protein
MCTTISHDIWTRFDGTKCYLKSSISFHFFIPDTLDLSRGFEDFVGQKRAVEISVLQALGWSATDAKERALAAVEHFESRGEVPSEDALLKRALSLRPR